MTPASSIITALPRRLATLLCLAGLAACASPAEQWIPAAETPKANKVELVRLSHPVRFSVRTASFAPGERQRLEAFLDGADVTPGSDRVILSAPADALAPARQAALRRALLRHGLRPTVLPAGTAPAAGEGPRPDTASLVVERYVVTPPDCPNWTKPTAGDPTNTASSNFGCASATNLGLMVADPRDLIAGRQPGPARAEPGLYAIENYRAGKPVVLPDDLSGNSSPGSSGAGPGSSAAGNGSTGGAGGAAGK